MSKEQQELLDEAYVNYGQKIISEDLWMLVAIGWPSNQEEFINKCKTDTEFSEKWGLKIEERELTDVERYTIARQYGLCPKYSNIRLENCTEEEHYNKFNVPTKLITITYKETIIESYE
jgi:hypothetical protein